MVFTRRINFSWNLQDLICPLLVSNWPWQFISMDLITKLILSGCYAVLWLFLYFYQSRRSLPPVNKKSHIKAPPPFSSSTFFHTMAPSYKLSLTVALNFFHYSGSNSWPKYLSLSHSALLIILKVKVGLKESTRSFKNTSFVSQTQRIKTGSLTSQCPSIFITTPNACQLKWPRSPKT